jgi:hypothetical protein
MSRRDEAVQWLKRGLLPAQVASQMRISVSSVVQYLCAEVGYGRLLRSEILFSVTRDVRNIVESTISELVDVRHENVLRWIKRHDRTVDLDDAAAYLLIRNPRIPLGDMYELISELEERFHGYIKDVFIREYGDEEWWRRGVPEGIRKECAGAREMDAEPAEHPFNYTTFIQLKEIFDKRWELLSADLSSGVRSDKRRFLSGLDQLNRVRNRVMHPVRRSPPTENDFAFLGEFWSFVAPSDSQSR